VLQPNEVISVRLLSINYVKIIFSGGVARGLYVSDYGAQSSGEAGNGNRR